jgi:acyl-homoserine lactone acylase PvdQ
MHGLELYNEWLTFPLNAYDEEIDRMFMNIDELDDELILDEIANFNSTGNFDNTSAMLIHMIWDRSIVEQKFEIKEGKSDRPNKQRELYEFARKNLGYKTTSYVG